MTLYQHICSFKTSDQAVAAEKVLQKISPGLVNVVNVNVIANCLTFQTDCVLGPITRVFLCHELNPHFVLWHRQTLAKEESPLSHKARKFPLWRRVTIGQVLFTATVFMLFCVFPLLDVHSILSVYGLWATLPMGLFCTVLVWYTSNDIFMILDRPAPSPKMTCKRMRRWQREEGRSL